MRLDSRGIAVADLDGDGDLDPVVVNRNAPTIKVYRNNAPGQGRALLVDLVAASGDPMAVGAQATARCEDLALLRQVEAGAGLLAQSPPTLHFGVGSCSRVESLEVRWPSGDVDTWTDLPVDHRVRLVEGSEEVDASPLRRRNYNRTATPLPALGELSAPPPPLELDRLDGGRLVLTELVDETVLLNFWATWCTACRAEMPDLEELYQELGPRGVRFVGASMDDGRPREAVEEFLAEHGVTYEQVWADLDDLRFFASLGSSPPGAIPITAVVHRGVVRAVRVGAIDKDEMATLLESLLGE